LLTNLINIVTYRSGTPSPPVTTSLATVLPVALRVDGTPCLVVGASTSAARRATDLVDLGATVTLVHPAPTPALEALAAETGSLCLHRRSHQHGDAAGHRLVFAATTNAAIDARVAADGRAHHALVHVEDRPELCDFYLPAIHRSGPVAVAVTTSGASPALARWLRTRLGALVGPEVGVVATALAAARARLRGDGRSTEGLDWSTLLDDDLLGGGAPRSREEVEKVVDAWVKAHT